MQQEHIIIKLLLNSSIRFTIITIIWIVRDLEVNIHSFGFNVVMEKVAKHAYCSIPYNANNLSLDKFHLFPRLCDNFFL